jgi:hypothetical protein
VIRDLAFDHGDDPALRGRLAPYQWRALEAIATCGTPAAGLHVELCDHCDHKRLKPNTCGNRCCPHCQGLERAAWVAARTKELLPCRYFHVVITLPPLLRAMAQAHPAVVLGYLMRAASDAIERLCRDPRFLGAEIGQLAVLHTWRRDLGWHPHVHLIVTGGGWHSQHRRWIPAKTFGTAKRRAFLLPKDLLGTVFLRRLRRLLLDGYDQQQFGDTFLPELASRRALCSLLRKTLATPAVLRIERPFAGPGTVLKYLGAYVNRVAISPQRIIARDRQAGTVTYTWSTNAEPDRSHTATIPARQFLLLFAQHVLPPGFQRIRFRGLWSTAHRSSKLHVVQAALANGLGPPPPLPPPVPRRDICPHCGVGHYQRVPGIRSRPAPAERRRILAELRREARFVTPVRAATCA